MARDLDKVNHIPGAEQLDFFAESFTFDYEQLDIFFNNLQRKMTDIFGEDSEQGEAVEVLEIDD